jgi:hypothetical protein
VDRAPGHIRADGSRGERALDFETNRNGHRRKTIGGAGSLPGFESRKCDIGRAPMVPSRPMSVRFVDFGFIEPAWPGVPASPDALDGPDVPDVTSSKHPRPSCHPRKPSLPEPSE